MQEPREEVPVAEAAIALAMTRERVIRLIQVGRLRGRRDRDRGWLIDQASLATLTKDACPA